MLRNMKNVVRGLTVLLGLLLVTPLVVHALPAATGILISEVQTGSTSAAGEEFIELYNAGAADVDVSNWKVQYFSASVSGFTGTPTRSVPLHGVLKTNQYYLVASTGYLTDKANETYTATLAKAGGHVRLVSPDPTDTTKFVEEDLLGWGTALHPEDTAPPAPAEGSSLQRKTNDDGQYVDTDNNADDFALNNAPTPEGRPLDQTSTDGTTETTPTDTGQTPADTTDPVSDTTDQTPLADATGSATQDVDAPTPTTSLPAQPVQLNELLPNPAAPASDSTDEYVELYNPNDQTVSLAGYKLQTGNNFSYSFVFTAEAIPGKSYATFYVGQTGLLLANASGKARLIDTTGSVTSETEYDTADEGQAWAFIGGSWQWTLLPTPNQTNILLLPAVKVTTTKVSTKKSTAKPKTVAKKVAKATTASAKGVKGVKTSAKKVAAVADANDALVEEENKSPIHPGILAAVAALAVGYALYEYRTDIKNRVYQLNRNRADRRTARKERPGR